MRLRDFFVGALALAACGACVGGGAPLEGTWVRPVADPDLGVAGTEYLTFAHDSTFSVVSDLTLEYADSLFVCSLGFRTKVGGRRLEEAGAVSLVYSPGSFGLDTVAGRVAIGSRTGVLADSVREAMAADLMRGLTEYYRLVYEGYSFEPGLVLGRPAVSGDIFGAFVDDTVAVRWTRCAADVASAP